MNSVKISVIIPVYNAERYLYKCLESVMNQTYSDWEVIAIDDGSQDSSFSILLEYASKDKRFKVSSQENQGPGYTRNKAIESISGDYVVFIDSDDYINVNYFEELVTSVSKNDPDIIFIDVIQENQDGKLLKYETMSKYKNSSKDTILRHQLTGKLPWGGVRKAVKASLIIDKNIRYSKDTVGEEALFSFQVLFHASKISFIDKVCYHYVNYPNSQSKKGEDDPWGGVCDNLKQYIYEQSLENEYGKTINSFAYTALVVSIFRISQRNPIGMAVRKSRERLNKFKSKYNYDLEKDTLETRTRCVLPILRFGMVSPVILVSKMLQVIKK